MFSLLNNVSTLSTAKFKLIQYWHSLAGNMLAKTFNAIAT